MNREASLTSPVSPVAAAAVEPIGDARDYERVFEGFLWHRGVPLLRIAPHRRATLEREFAKQFDYLVLPARGERLLVEVKGRRFRSARGMANFKDSWAPLEDLESLGRWQRRFGPGFVAGFCFVHRLGRREDAECFVDTWGLGDQGFGLSFIPVDDYARGARARSVRWRTVALAGAEFQALAQPLSRYLGD